MFYDRTAGEETAAAWFKDLLGGEQDEGEATKYQSAFRLGLSTLFFGGSWGWGLGLEGWWRGGGGAVASADINIYSEHSARAPSISSIRAHM